MPDETRDQDFQKNRGNSIFILITVTLLYIINYMDRTIISVTLPLIKADLNFSDAQLGWLGSIYFIMVSILTIPAGIIVDRWSRKKSLAVMAVIWSIATYLTGRGNSFLALLNARGWVGIGEAGFAPGGMAYLSGSFPEKSRAKVMGFFTMGGPIGLILGALLGGYIAKANLWGLGWRAPYYLFAIPGVLFGILILFTRDYSTSAPKDISAGSGIFKDMGLILRFRTFWFLSLGLAVNLFGATAILQFMPLYLMRTRGWDVAKSSAMFGLVFVFAAVGAILAGVIADKWKEKRNNARPLATAVYALLNFIFLTIGLAADFKGWFVIGYIGLTGTAVLGYAMLSPLGAAIMDLAPLRLRSLSMALMLFVAYLLASPGSTVIGWFSDIMGTPDNPNLMAAFAVIPVFYLVAALLCFLGARFFTREFEMAAGIEEPEQISKPDGLREQVSQA